MVAAASSRYEVVCRLAGGGMAELFLARATALAGFERLVVVKRLAPHLTDDPAMVQALYDEARIAAALQHANIVQVTDVEVVDGKVSIVMEFLHGHDVSQLLRKLRRLREPLPLDQAIAIGLSVSAGLHHAHERVAADGRPLEIVHRDISPHNVVVTYDGAVKIVDFGIARAVTRRGHTAAGLIKGKPGYIAPEQLRGKRIDRRTDVWATGVLLYEMTTGTPPYGVDITLDQLTRVVHEDPPPPSTRIADYPRDLEAIVMHALARDPAARPRSAEELRIALDGFARSRKLDLSPFGLTALMERVFASQLAAWRHAQQQGLSLADHVLAGRASRSFEAIDLTTEVEPDFEPTWPSAILHDVEIATPPSFPAAVPERRRWPRAVLMVLAAPLVILAGIASWSLLRGSDTTSQRLPARGDVVSAPMPITPTPAAAPEKDEVVVDPPARPETSEVVSDPTPKRPRAPAKARAKPAPKPAKKQLSDEDLDAPLPP